MEGGKRAEEAGPSSGCSSFQIGEEEKHQKKEAAQTKIIMTDERAFDVEDDDQDDEEELLDNFVPAPPIPLKDQIDKNKDDESLRRWKEKLLGCLESDLDGQVDPEVIFHSIGILSDDFGEINTPLPVDEVQNGCPLFTLKEGSEYQLKLSFTVLHNIVSGLAYTNAVWKGGMQVDRSKGMLVTFSPQREPYVHTLEEETTPSGVLARGIYTAKLKFEDDDRRCHLELNYSFEIKKGY